MSDENVGGLVERINALQEFRPNANKHTGARRGFVCFMSPKSSTCEGEEYGWLRKGDVLAALSAHGQPVVDEARLDAIVGSVSQQVGYGPAAWDMVSPRAIVQAVITALGATP